MEFTRRSVAAFLAVACACSVTSPRDAAGQDLPFDPSAGVQLATAADISIVAPYIGRWRTATTDSERFGQPTFYEIDYQWVDQGQTTVSFRVATVGAESGDELSFLEGYYGFDPFGDRLFAVAVFSWGGAGIADLAEFDHQTGHRVIHARAPGPGDTVIHIRDVFDIVDTDHWRNRTYTRQESEGEWQLVYDAIFTRVDAAD